MRYQSLREPRQDAREEHHREIRYGQLVIARRSAAAPFDPREEVLDQEARSEELAIMRALESDDTDAMG